MRRTLGLLVMRMMTVGLTCSSVCCGSANGERAMDPKKVVSDLTGGDVKVRRSAAESLLNLASAPQQDRAIRDNLKTLAQIVEDKEGDPEVRSQIVRAMAIVSQRKRVDQDIVPGLIKVLLNEKEKEAVRSWIAMSLPDLAPAEIAGPPLLAASRSNTKSVRMNAAQQLGRVRIEPDKVIDWVRQTFADADPSMRAVAVGTAAELSLRDRRGLEVVLLGMADRDETVRREAMGVILHGNVVGTDNKDARKALERLLKDPVPAVAMSAAAALMQMAPKDRARYLAVLIEGLQAGDAKIREAAAQVLALCGLEAKDAVPALKKTVKDSNDLVRVHSAMALTRITGKKEPYRGVLRELGRSSNAQVMMWAKLYQGILLSEAGREGNKKG